MQNSKSQKVRKQERSNMKRYEKNEGNEAKLIKEYNTKKRTTRRREQRKTGRHRKKQETAKQEATIYSKDKTNKIVNIRKAR